MPDMPDNPTSPQPSNYDKALAALEAAGLSGDTPPPAEAPATPAPDAAPPLDTPLPPAAPEAPAPEATETLAAPPPTETPVAEAAASTASESPPPVPLPDPAPAADETDSLFSTEPLPDFTGTDDEADPADAEPASPPAKRGARSRVRAIIFWVVLALCVVVLSYSLAQIIQIQAGYKVAIDEYDRLQELYYPPARPPAATAPADEPAEEEEEPTPELWEINPDYVGWMEIPGTVVSYPLVLGPNNDRYLNHTFEGVQNAAGTIFADYRNSRDFSSPHTIIYGHNLKNGRMFGGLHEYLDAVYLRQNQLITIYTREATLTWRIFSARVTDMYDASYRLDFASDAEISAFIAAYGGPESATRMLTLSTCTNNADEERLVVHAALEKVDPAA